MIKDKLEDIKTQNFLKVIGFIILALILLITIFKKATRNKPALHEKNEQKTELRLRDTIEDDEESVSSSSSS